MRKGLALSLSVSVFFILFLLSVNVNSATSTKIGIFYSIWHCPYVRSPYPFVVSKILAGEQEWGPLGTVHFWGEPQVGFYCLWERPDVLKKHAEMIRDMGIDFVFLDITNWNNLQGSKVKDRIIDPYNKLLEVWNTIHDAPKVVPWVPFTGSTFDPNTNMVDYLAEKLKQYPNLQFIYEGKPLLLITYKNENQINQEKVKILGEDFTIKKMRTALVHPGEGAWGFISMCRNTPSPESNLPCNQKHSSEQLTVALAYQRTFMSTIYGPSPPVPKQGGLTLRKQFETAFKNPNIPVLTIVGWNEWTARRGDCTGKANCPCDKYSEIGCFVDAYKPGYNRDAEPSKEEGDFYYRLLKSCLSIFRRGEDCETPGNSNELCCSDAVCNTEGTNEDGVCDPACGASQWCEGKNPGDSIPYCTKAGETFILDKCSNNCQPVDRATKVCEADYDCTADNECDGMEPGTDSCDESCNYQTPECTRDSDCNDNNPCTDDSCVNYVCVNTNDDTNACSDNLWCTINDHCSSGQCIGDERNCGDNIPCTLDSCNENNDRCEHDTSTCQCTQDSDCNDNNPCTDDSCVNYVCVNTNDDTNACSDNLWCTINDHCSSGQCVGDERDCGDNIPCTLDSCNENNDRCEHDQDYCPCAEDSDCNDNNPCTDDSCVNYQCVNQNDNTNPCSDNLWCTINDHCSSGQCIGDERNCSDNESCTLDSCNEINRICEHDSGPCRQPCNLTKAYWNTSQAAKGETVKLIAEGFSCEGETAAFLIKEDELLKNKTVENPPGEAVFQEKAETLWTAEYQDAFTKNPYYYFIISVNTTSISSKDHPNGTLEVVKSLDLDNDSVTNDEDCNDYNSSIGKCKGCSVCSDPENKNGTCIPGSCPQLECNESSVCGGGDCKEDELAVYPGKLETTCMVIENMGVCTPNHCEPACIKNESCLKDSDNDEVVDANDKCPNSQTKNVNMFGCALPKYKKFKNEITTNFSKIDLLAAKDVTIGIPETGKIEFKQNVINLVGKDLDKYIDIQHNKITVNTARLPELNRPAIITFYNVNYQKPLILLDGVYCSECKFISYENKLFKFLAPHLSTYSLTEADTYAGFCGDKFCSSSESCSTCYRDCSVCPRNEPGPCTESWTCDEWSACSENNTATRTCVDLNNCGTFKNKPEETIGCAELQLQELQKYTYMIILGTILLLFSLTFVISDMVKKRRLKGQNPELDSLVEHYLLEGRKKSRIRQLLLSKGYTEKEIENSMKRVGKNY